MRNRLISRSVLAVAAAAALCTGLTGQAAATAGHTDGTVHAQTISRAHVIENAEHWLNNRGIDYNPGATAKGADGHYYRKDCSGFVSEALAMHPASAPNGPNTELMANYVSRIGYANLLPGDVIGLLGAGTGGANGHVMLFRRWADAAHKQVVVWEHGGGSGANAYPHQSVYTWPVRDSRGTFYAFRYKGIGS